MDCEGYLTQSTLIRLLACLGLVEDVLHLVHEASTSTAMRGLVIAVYVLADKPAKSDRKVLHRTHSLTPFPHLLSSCRKRRSP